MFSSEYSEIFMNTYIEEHLRTDALETSFPRTKKLFFWKTGVPFYSWKYYDWKRKIFIQNCLAKSQCWDKYNGKYKMGSTKWTHHKEWSFTANCFIFSKIIFDYKNILQIVYLMYQPPKCPYSYFSLGRDFYFRVCFP